MIRSYRAADGIDVISSSFPIPGFGFVPINAFVFHGPEPMLVDCGAVVETEAFLEVLGRVIDPAELRWIWLSHTDPDHTGALRPLLAMNPRIRLITTFLGAGILGLSAPLPMDRIHLVNPGESIQVGNRQLTAVRPPAYDNPITTGFRDERSGALFCGDCFGALLQEVPDNAAALPAEELRAGQVQWGTMDSSWLHNVDRNRFQGELERYGALHPELVLSGHLPPAPGRMMGQLLESLATVPDAPAFVGPNQAQLEQMLAQMGAPPA